MSGIATAIVAGTVVSAGVGYMASKDASKTQANAANNAAQLQSQAANNSAQMQMDMFNKQQANLQPYNSLGQQAINPLLAAMGYNSDITVNPNSPLQQKFSYGDFTAPTAAQAAQTPGYQFTLGQGLESVQNSAAARGLGTSGAALKGASTYATGLANQTYNDVYNRALQAYNTNFNKAQQSFNTNYNSASANANRLAGIVQQGQNAAAGVGSMGMTAAGNAGNMLTSGANNAANSLTSGANATASGIVGGANALTGAINNGSNLALTNALMTQNGGSGLFGRSSSTGVFGGNGASTANNLTNWGA